MIDLKEFRKCNGLSQKDVAEFLGVSRSFIGQVEAGFSKLPSDKIDKLLANDNGWDVSCLIYNREAGDHIHQNGGKNNIGKITYDNENAALKKEIEMLSRQLEELMRRNQEYWELIKELMKKK